MYHIKKINIIIVFLIILHLTGFSKDLVSKYELQWEDSTIYTKSYIVDNKNPNASDMNPGTPNLPLLSISKAVQLVKAGEKVVIHSGIYREAIILKNSGKSARKMISIEAAPGEKVIIKGSRELNVKWIQNLVATDEPLKKDVIYTWLKGIWACQLPDSLFENDYNPFQLQNIEPKEFDLMPWAWLVKNRAPYNLARGMLFQDGKRMMQIASIDDLRLVAGSFYVAKANKILYIHPFEEKNPNNAFFELVVQSHLLRPAGVGFGYVRLSGLSFEHCANGFLRTSTGAVTTWGGHHWIIENNTFSQINSSALEFGYYAFENGDDNPLNQPRGGKEEGNTIVRNNIIHDCGTAGIRSYYVINGLIENNTIYNCGWQNAENYWEVAGIKLLQTRNTLIKGNHIYNITGGNGIWLDWDNRYSQIKENIIYNIQTIQGGIFIEASQYPNLIDHNFIWNINGNGVLANDADEVIIINNLIGHTSNSLVRAEVATNRFLNGRALTTNRNKVINNIFIDGGEPISLQGKENIVDYNLYIFTFLPKSFFLNKWIKQSGFDCNSSEIEAKVSFDSDLLLFNFESNMEIPKMPCFELSFKNTEELKKVENCLVLPGPFFNLGHKNKILLKIF
ncbi:MAG TPA: right-handed parallel beta-helix repeat-containing protein [Paludibacteraceae bacterium]|nr:right-handed parallel beta-helix repeat-containing protein [Paludibacteraceae bacterium]HOL00408.1 right-handed parallel beta-helix repeat-containing protein [Paludibacteraceae bacterium]HPO66908.1 right-handed parallel beta-helix repeat-containing protein [Paludibacteraceae bacterium]HRU63419.1 right-handed parallel beta-helix repeat-containing protein [Paludibacteraceae bacterium]